MCFTTLLFRTILLIGHGKGHRVAISFFLKFSCGRDVELFKRYASEKPGATQTVACVFRCSSTLAFDVALQPILLAGLKAKPHIYARFVFGSAHKKHLGMFFA